MRLKFYSILFLVIGFTVTSCNKRNNSAQPNSSGKSPSISIVAKTYNFVVSAWHVKWEDGSLSRIQNNDGSISSSCNPGGNFCRGWATTGFARVDGSTGYYNPVTDAPEYIFQELNAGQTDGILNGYENGKFELFFDNQKIGAQLQTNLKDGFFDTEEFGISKEGNSTDIIVIAKGSYPIKQFENIIEIDIPEGNIVN